MAHLQCQASALVAYLWLIAVACHAAAAASLERESGDGEANYCEEQANGQVADRSEPEETIIKELPLTPQFLSLIDSPPGTTSVYFMKEAGILELSCQGRRDTTLALTKELPDGTRHSVRRPSTNGCIEKWLEADIVSDDVFGTYNCTATVGNRTYSTTMTVHGDSNGSPSNRPQASTRGYWLFTSLLSTIAITYSACMLTI